MDLLISELLGIVREEINTYRDLIEHARRKLGVVELVEVAHRLDRRGDDRRLTEREAAVVGGNEPVGEDHEPVLG